MLRGVLARHLLDRDGQIDDAVIADLVDGWGDSTTPPLDDLITTLRRIDADWENQKWVRKSARVRARMLRALDGWDRTGDGTPLPGLARAIAAFPEDYNELDIAIVMTSPMDGLGGNVIPRDWLTGGGSIDTLLRKIDQLGWV